MKAEGAGLASEDWLKFLAEAGPVLAGSLESEEILRTVARLCVPRLADWCVVDLFDGTGKPFRVAVEHADPAQVEKATEIQRRYPPDPEAPHGAVHVARTGKSELYPVIPDELLVKVARDEEHLRLLREVGMVSAMVVPLVAGGRSLGAITFICSESGCRYSQTDLEMAEELARRAGLAVENARLYEQAQEALAERERLMRELEAERARLDAVLRQLPSGVVIADADSGRIAMTNDQMAPLLSFKGRPISSIDEFDRREGFHPDGRPFTPEEWPLIRVIRSGETITNEEADCLRSDGSLISVSINAAPVRDREGRIVAAVAVYHDVTQRKRDAQALAEQREWFQVTLASIGDAVIVTDADGRITFTNPVAETLTGWTSDAASGQPLETVFDILDESTGEPMQNPVGKVLRTGRIVGLANHTVLRSRDGRMHPIDDSAAPIRAGDGTVRGVVLVFRDVTQRRRAEETLRRAEEQYRSLVTATSQVVWGTDASGELNDMPQWRELTGQSREQVRGEGWLDAVHPDDRERVRRAWLQAFESQTQYQTEYRLRLRDGSYRWYLVRGVPMLATDGSVREWVGTCTDIDDRRWAEEQLRLANKELASARDLALEASRAKSAFLANMSHELRTPLNAIIGYSEMLEEEALNCEGEVMGTDLRKIQTAGRHLLTLINDVLDLSKIEAGKMELYVARFPIAPLVELAVETVQPMAEKHGNSLIVEVPPDIGTMRADETKLRQILFNLLSNACKFTEDGSISLEVSREAGNEREWILFRVADTGVGMDSQELISLFREFTQLDPSSTRKYGGTGLGLAISRRFARMMGGDITVRSEKREGSVFTLRVPAAVEGKPSGAETEETVSTEELIRSAAAFGPAHNVVLVIDDDPTVHDLIRRTLEREGFAVASAYNGKSGLEMARRLHPRAITLDVMMPQVDGWTVLSELKADPALADTPVIVISIVDDRNLGFALGATDYMTKPIERERLLNVLRRFECDLRGCRVLLVGDEPQAREMMVRILEGAGSQVIPAASGEEALELLEKTPLDLILLDLIMPEMDGFEFLEAVRRVPKWRAIPIVALTAKELSDHDRQRLNGAVERILQKGGDLRDDLLREVCDVIVTLGIGGSE